MSSTEPDAGFTLLEMMAVMLIIALASSSVIDATPGTGRAGLKAITLQTAAMLRRERVSAILGGRTNRVSLDRDRRVLVGDGGERVVIPRDVVLDVLGVDALWGAGSRWFASTRTARLRGLCSSIRAKRLDMKFGSIGTPVVSRSRPCAGDSKQAGFTLLEALVALTIVLALAGVLGRVLSSMLRRIMLHADDRVAAQILLRALLQIRSTAPAWRASPATARLRTAMADRGGADRGHVCSASAAAVRPGRAIDAAAAHDGRLPNCRQRVVGTRTGRQCRDGAIRQRGVSRRGP